MKKKLLMFDRDGTINAKGKEHYVFHPKDFEIYSDAVAFLSIAYKKGYKLAVITNQQGIAKGIYTLQHVMQLHEDLCRLTHIPINDFRLYVCSHLENSCSCRKPRPELLLRCLRDFKIQRKEALYIGDSMDDLQAARGANIDFIQIVRDSVSTNKDIQESKTAISSFSELFQVLQR